MLRLGVMALCLMAAPTYAQVCGPDPAPAQAAALGLTCQTFRWGSGDTLAEIAPVGSTAPNYKFYPGTVEFEGRDATAADWSMPTTGPSAGKLVIQLASTDPGGTFVVNTCRNPGSSNVGQSFTGAFYWQVALTYGNFSCCGSVGAYGLSKEMKTPAIADGYEVDNVDGTGGAWGKELAHWWVDGTNGANEVAHKWGVGGSAHHDLAVPGVGDRNGVLVYPQGPNNPGGYVTYWWGDHTLTTDVADGSATSPAGDPGSLAQVISNHHCLGLIGNQSFPITVESFMVWQAPSGLPPPPPGGSRRFPR